MLILGIESSCDETPAAVVRADFSAHFPEGIELSREVWIVLHSWQDD